MEDTMYGTIFIKDNEIEKSFEAVICG